MRFGWGYDYYLQEIDNIILFMKI